jgi:hypothetical protein
MFNSGEIIHFNLTVMFCQKKVKVREGNEKRKHVVLRVCRSIMPAASLVLSSQCAEWMDGWIATSNGIILMTP